MAPGGYLGMFSGDSFDLAGVLRSSERQGGCGGCSFCGACSLKRRGRCFGCGVGCGFGSSGEPAARGELVLEDCMLAAELGASRITERCTLAAMIEQKALAV